MVNIQIHLEEGEDILSQLEEVGMKDQAVPREVEGKILLVEEGKIQLAWEDRTL